MDKNNNNINDVIHRLINTPVMNLILDDDLKTLNNLKNYLKKEDKNVKKKGYLKLILNVFLMNH